MEYGYMENGYLRSQILEPSEVRIRYENGETVVETVSVQEQVETLDAIWKPVDQIDEARLHCEEDYIIRLVPYDDGDRIAYEYRKVFDIQRVNKRISNLQNALSATDYRVIKCYEASLLGQELPYDFQALHVERQAVRDQINELEQRLSSETV